MKILSLNGPWSLRNTKENDWHEAQVPGTVYTDLLRDGLIEDPFWRENEHKTFDLMEDDWEYRRAFSLTAEDLKAEAALLRCEGLEIVDRNVRPAPYDRRLEIDVVAYDPPSDTMVFVEVKQHGSHLQEESVLRGITERKRRNLLKAFGAWRSANKWYGSTRFDVVEVFGRPGHGRPEVDHIRSVRLVPYRKHRDETFVGNWFGREYTR